MTKTDVAALNRRRQLVRYFPLGIAVLELAAVLLIMAGVRAVGMALGLVVLAGGFVVKLRIKKNYTETCCRLQTLSALPVTESEYLGESKETAEWLQKTHLLPASAVVTQPLVLHGIKGKMRGMEMQLGEMTFGCHENGKKAATYSSGVLVRVPLAQPVQEKVLFLGKYAFKHAALRAEYEKDGMRLSPAGGKEKGWYALTAGAVSPSDSLCEKWDAVCTAAKQRAALYAGENELVAFFNGQFYTGEFAIDEELTESVFRKHSFTAIIPLLELVEALNG